MMDKIYRVRRFELCKFRTLQVSNFSRFELLTATSANLLSYISLDVVRIIRRPKLSAQVTKTRLPTVTSETVSSCPTGQPYDRAMICRPRVTHP